MRGASFQITQSARQVLQRLRHPEKVERIWIDGLCINQRDLAEKEVVVKRMRDIYSSASEVLVWLGECSREEESFVDDYLQWKESKELGTPYNFLSLLTRSWFTRRWILQEAALAKPHALTAACGSHTFSWDAEDGFATFLLDPNMGLHVGKGRQSSRVQKAIRTVRFIDESRSGERLPCSLFHVLLRTQYTDASNITDYITAVLGLACDWNADSGLSLRYGSPGEENSAAVKRREFVNFATWDVVCNKSIRVLAYASGPKEGSGTGGLPSWVPD